MNHAAFLLPAWLFAIGLYGIITSRHFVHLIGCLTVVQALVLTDIVVGATVTALLLALALQVHKRKGTLDPHQLRPLRS